MHIFYTGSLFTLKRLNHSFSYMLLYQAARSLFAVANSLRFGQVARLLAVPLAQPKILLALPRVWRHRRMHLTQKGVFLADLEVPVPDASSVAEAVREP